MVQVWRKRKLLILRVRASVVNKTNAPRGLSPLAFLFVDVAAITVAGLSYFQDFITSFL